MLVYGGYSFPREPYLFGEGDLEEGRDSADGGAEPARQEVLRYWFESESWEVLNTSAAVYQEQEEGRGNDTMVTRVPRLPAPRYGHTAVLYEVKIKLLTF